MGKRFVAVWLLCFLLFAEASSWVTAGGLGPCLIAAEHSQQTANNDEQQDCPTFFAGSLILGQRGFEWVKSNDNDKAVVAGFTIVLAISTIGLWLATVDLYRAGERQIEFLRMSTEIQSRDMQDSIGVARASANAAQTAADHVPKTERAYLFLELDLRSNIYGLYQDVIASDSPREAFVEFGFQNHGRTPAIVESLQVTACYWILSDPTPPAMGIAPQLPIQPGLVVSTTPIRGYRAKFNVPQANYENVIAGRGVFLFWGRIIYRDVFQELHETGWCRVTACDGKGWLFGDYPNLNYYT